MGSVELLLQCGPLRIANISKRGIACEEQKLGEQTMIEGGCSSLLTTACGYAWCRLRERA
jgi:hypothetical protein